MKTTDLTGMRFGHLTALRPNVPGRPGVWACRCDCGREIPVQRWRLLTNNTGSCGCRHYEAISGQRHHSARLTAETVGLARRLHAEGYSLAEIRDHLPERVDKSTLSLAIARKTWKHVD